MELSEVRGAEENRVMKETMNEKDFIELMNNCLLYTSDAADEL